jgi:methylmalonyl-CoA/ethylmalonyl-CoA epimerase
VIDGLWHSTLMGSDYDELLTPLQRLFGAVVMHDLTSVDPAVGRRGGMVWLGDNSVEVGAPVGERSPVRRFVERMGGGMHSIALRLPDVDAVADVRQRLAEADVAVAAAIGDDVLFSHPSDTSGLMLEWSARRTDDDPRFGHPLPGEAPACVAPVSRYGFVTAAVADPSATAELLAGLLGTDVVRDRPGAPPGEVCAAVSLVDCLLVLFALPDEAGDWPWGSAPLRPRFHGHGLVVDDLGASLAALEQVGVRAVAELEDAVLLDPAALPVATFLSERLLAGDPRDLATAPAPADEHPWR